MEKSSTTLLAYIHGATWSSGVLEQDQLNLEGLRGQLRLTGLVLENSLSQTLGFQHVF